jgi:hypothetical protein
VLYGADFRFWEVYGPKIFPNFAGEMWSVSEQARERFGTYWIRCGKDNGFCEEPDTINGGGNSGHQALHLAATFGAKRIVLLGFDMQRTDGKEHWHGKHEGNLPNGKGFPNWIKSFAFLARDLEKKGVEVINCTRRTALRCFKAGELRETLQQQVSAGDGSRRVDRVGDLQADSDGEGSTPDAGESDRVGTVQD